MDSCHIISGAELRRLKRRSMLWMMGWIATAILALALAMTAGQLHAERKMRAEVLQMQVEARTLQLQQSQVIADLDTAATALEAAWKHNAAIGDTLASWGDFIRERHAIVDENKAAMAQMKGLKR